MFLVYCFVWLCRFDIGDHCHFDIVRDFLMGTGGHQWNRSVWRTYSFVHIMFAYTDNGSLHCFLGTGGLQILLALFSVSICIWDIVFLYMGKRSIDIFDIEFI